MRAFNFIATVLAFSVTKGYDSRDERSKDDILDRLQELIEKVDWYDHRPFVTCLGGVELVLYGCLNDYAVYDDEKWTYCKDEFGHILNKLNRYNGGRTFTCPLDTVEPPKKEKSFFKKNWKTILGGGLGMVALPGG